jgi:hypothetical protein
MEKEKTVATPAPAVDVEDEVDEVDEADEVDDEEEKVEDDTKSKTKQTKEPKADTDVEDDEETKDEVDDGYLEVDFLKEKKKLTKEEAKVLAQKGMNYDHVKEKADRAERAEAELAELKMKMTEQEMQKGKDNLEKRLLKDGYDKEEIKQITAEAFKEQNALLESVKAESRKTMALARIAVEKEALRKRVPLFDEVEPEIDNLIASRPDVPLSTAYAVKFGELALSGKLQEILEGKKKSAIADYSDKAKRSGLIKADNAPAAEDYTSTMDDKAMKATLAFGNDPKKVSKYIFKEQKKKG